MLKIAYDIFICQKSPFQYKHNLKQSCNEVSNIEINDNDVVGLLLIRCHAIVLCKMLIKQQKNLQTFIWVITDLVYSTETVVNAFSKHVIFGLGTNDTLWKTQFKEARLYPSNTHASFFMCRHFFKLVS